MRAMSKADLQRARRALSAADISLSLCRGIFISAGYTQGASAVSTLIGRIADLIAKIDRAQARKP